MAASPLKIGPYIGGLNTYSDTTAVEDTEVVQLLNFDLDLDGSLVSRPPVVSEGATPGTGVMKLLGYFTASDGVQYLLGSSRGSTGTYFFSEGSWLLITSTISATCFVQYANRAWLVAAPGTANPCVSWVPSTGATTEPNMKKGNAAVVYKERMFIAEGGTGVNSSRIYFSNAAAFATWGASDFFDVKTGDGQDILDMVIYSDVITIFKQNSCYIFSYESRPASGQIRVISTTIGVARKDCIVEYENNLYLLHGKNVYAVVNWNYEKLNIKVPLGYVNTQPSALVTPYDVSIIGERLVVRYYDKWYVYGLKTKVWAEWRILTNVGKFFKLPTALTTVDETYYATGQWTTADNIYSFVEGYDAVRSETIAWAITTKSYDFDSPFKYKRLMWWGVDIIPKAAFTAQAFPISYGRKMTWAEARAFTWAQMREFTWARPSSTQASVDTILHVSGSPNRVFVKLLKSLRFRQLSFRLSGSNTGMTTDSPIRIFAVTAFIDSKQVVSQQVT